MRIAQNLGVIRSLRMLYGAQTLVYVTHPTVVLSVFYSTEEGTENPYQNSAPQFTECNDSNAVERIELQSPSSEPNGSTSEKHTAPLGENIALLSESEPCSSTQANDDDSKKGLLKTETEQSISNEHIGIIACGCCASFIAFLRWISQPFQPFMQPIRLFRKRFDKLSDVSNKDRRLSFKEVYSAIVPTLLEFMYGASVLTVQAISAHSMSNFGMEEGNFLSLCFGILFTGATISHILFYIVPCNFRKAFITTSYFFAVGLLCSAFQQNLIAILLGRFLIGFAAGIIVSYLPTYLCEIAPAHVKQYFTALNVGGFALGVLAFTSLYSLIVKYYFWVMIFMATLSFILPFFLYMCMVFNRELETNETLRSLFKNREAFRSIAIIVLLYTVFNLCGINQVFSNPKVFYGEDNYQTHVICTLGLSIVCLAVSCLIFKRWDVKPAIIISATTVVASCIAFFFSYQVQIFTYIFSAGYNLGLSHSPFYVLGVILPDRYRVAGTFLGLTVNRIVAVVSVFIPLGSPQQMYTPVFIGYALLTAVSALYVCLVYRNTKGQRPDFQRRMDRRSLSESPSVHNQDRIVH